MDPLSQGVFGALFSSAATSSKRSKAQNRAGLVLGFLSGMAADLDVLISSDSDPLLSLEYHRHFTHSLAFVPVGALICTLVLGVFLRKRGLRWSEIYLFSLLGYGSHGLLDSFTSYGTQLYWPFSSARVAWDSISIIDPLFTLPLLAFLIVFFKGNNSFWKRVAGVWAFAYLSLGILQRERAIRAVEALVAERGHEAIRIQAKPSIGNLLVFRGLYETQDEFYVDAVRVSIGGAIKVYPGSSKSKATQVRPELLELMKSSTVLGHDLRRFAWFSNDFLTWHNTLPNTLSDFRYSMLPNSTEELWGLSVNLDKPEEHGNFINFRVISSDARAQLWAMISGAEL